MEYSEDEEMACVWCGKLYYRGHMTWDGHCSAKCEFAEDKFREEERMKARAKEGRLFSLGMVLATPGASEALTESGQFIREFLDRHTSGDWSDVCKEDRKENELSVRKGFRIFSACHLKSGRKIWVITEADRSATTILLPGEY